MPYSVVKRDNQYCVFKHDADNKPTGEALGCHDTQADADSQMAAIYVNENKMRQLAYDAPISIIKTANGRYRWYGASSVNVKDVDGETFSERAMLADVARTKAHGDTSILAAFHLVDPANPQALRLGGAPDWREVVNGHLLESGLFDDTPLARGFAKFFMAHPEGVDGSGNAMSIGFNGYPDAEKIYQNGVIKERSVLPRSQAAVPYTMFGIGGNMEERQTKFLEQMKSMMDDAEVVNAARLMLAASSQSKALDEAGMQRKAASEAVAIPVVTAPVAPVAPVTINFNAPGTYQTTSQGGTTGTIPMPPSEALGFSAKSAAPAVEATAPAAVQPAAPTNVAPSATTSAAPTTVAPIPPAQPTPAAPVPTPPPVAPVAPVQQTDPAPASPTPAEVMGKLSDTDLKGIAQYVEGELTSFKEQIATLLATEIPKMMKAAQATAQTEIVKAYNEQPVDVFSRLKALKASAGNTTLIDENHPLYKASMADEQDDDPGDDYAANVKERLGFGKKRQNGAKA